MANETTITKFHIGVEQWDNVLATWASMASDLGSYYAYYSCFIETDESAPEYLRVAKQLSSSDSWRLQINTGYYQAGNPIVGTAAGYFPTLNHWVYQMTSPGEYALSRSDTNLTVGSSQFNAATFKEGTVPYCLGILVHGAGGGGGGTWGSDDGTGGGAGGCIAGVLKLSTTATLHIGAGGAGGYKKEVNSSVGGGGANGGDTWIYLNSIVLKAYGGGYGRASTKSEAYAGGSGGLAVSNNTSNNVFCTSSAQGGNGGKVYNKGPATGMAAQTVKVTSLSTVISGATHVTASATNGGAQGDNNAPGGGGGGREFDGPAGGDFMSDGKPGSKGCGGSGARYTFATYKRGGKGGDGYITLFY